MIFIIFLFSLALAAILTPLVRNLAIKLKVVDVFGKSERKIHKKNTPLLGGLVIFLSFFIILFIVKQSAWWPEGKVLDKHLIGLFIAGSLLMIGGFLDDKYNLKPIQQIVWPILACFVVVISGIGIEYINNPFGPGYLHLDNIKIEILRFKGVPYYLTPWADMVTFIWLILLMYSTKFLDGLDGLVSGITVIGALVIAGLALATQFYQPDVGIMSLILAGAALGFLFFNWHPAKIFLGEGGSLFTGFILGSLAIISGGKVATTFLILGLAVIDLISVIIRRIFIEHISPFKGDKKHFHFRLLEIGFSHRLVVIFYWSIALIFGLTSLFLQTRGKIIALFVLIIFGVALISLLPFKKEKSIEN